MSANEDEIEAMVKGIDKTNGGEEIDFPDFVRVMSRQVDPEFERKSMLKAFTLLAGAHNEHPGHISTKILHSVLARLLLFVKLQQ